MLIFILHLYNYIISINTLDKSGLDLKILLICFHLFDKLLSIFILKQYFPFFMLNKK